jgi:hypothetical protein
LATGPLGSESVLAKRSDSGATSEILAKKYDFGSFLIFAALFSGVLMAC